MGVEMKVVSPIVVGGEVIQPGVRIVVESQADAKHLERRGKAERIEPKAKAKR